MSGGTHPLNVNEYKVQIFEGNPESPDSIETFWEGNVSHQYGLGAWELVRKSIEAAFGKPT